MFCFFLPFFTQRERQNLFFLMSQVKPFTIKHLFLLLFQPRRRQQQEVRQSSRFPARSPFNIGASSLCSFCARGSSFISLLRTFRCESSASQAFPSSLSRLRASQLECCASLIPRQSFGGRSVYLPRSSHMHFCKLRLKLLVYPTVT